jgi:hypothetical protein
MNRNKIAPEPVEQLGMREMLLFYEKNREMSVNLFLLYSNVFDHSRVLL